MLYCKTDYSKCLIIRATIIVTCFLPQVESIFTESRFMPEAQSQSTGKWKCFTVQYDEFTAPTSG